MWTIYDQLIAAIPEDSLVRDCLIGSNWIAVRSDGVGIAMKPLEDGSPAQRSGTVVGMRTRDLAGWVKSWNFVEAAIGLAAINSALNTAARVEALAGQPLADIPGQNVFHHLADQLRGRKVAVIGHFPGLEWLRDICSLSILERKPHDGDLPDSACEFVLGEQDVVIMTATTLINKTMPRLLQLSRRGMVVVCGPSTPLHPVMFDHGAVLLGGLVVVDEAVAWRAVQEGIERGLLSTGSKMVQLSRPIS